METSTTDSPIIRRVTADDAEAIAAIYHHYVTDTTISFETEAPDPEEMRRRISLISADYPYLVCECAGRVVGFCYAHPWKERAAYSSTLETTVYIAGDMKGRGIGQMLMRRLISECREAGVHSLIACITGENIESRRFHASLGFTEVSYFSQVGCKFGRMLDVVDCELLLQ